MTTKEKLSSEAGVTLVELMVVALIIIIVATIAFLNAGDANPQFQRQNATRQLKAVLERARFDSVKRRAVNDNEKASVTVAGTSFILTTDVTLNGLTTDSGDAATTFADAGITIQRYDGATLDSTNNKVAFGTRIDDHCIVVKRALHIRRLFKRHQNAVKLSAHQPRVRHKELVQIDRFDREPLANMQKHLGIDRMR